MKSDSQTISNALPKVRSKKPLRTLVKLKYILVFTCVLAILGYHSFLKSNRDILDEATAGGLTVEEDAEEGDILEKIGCQIPDLKPFNESISKFVWDPSPVNCTTIGHPLLFKTDLESNLIQVESIVKHGYARCCYQGFERNESDKSAIFDPGCTLIESQKTRIKESLNMVRLNCTKLSGGDPVTVDMFGFVHLKPEVEDKIKKIDAVSSGRSLKDFGHPPRRRVNVVIFGTDSVSHMTLQRAMPQSYEYMVKNLSAVHFDGYTKVGENTFPNLVPILSGLSEDELKASCWPNKTTPFDDCPFIWSNYSAQGYRTAYGEDAVWMGIFNYQKRGFRKAPTDYYNPALAQQLDKTIGHNKLVNAMLCYGPRLAFSLSLDFLQKMAFTMNKTRRYFQFIWTTAMTHDYMNQAKVGDEELLQTLVWFKEEGYLEDTALILMSDHGMNSGKFRATAQGRAESSMPFLYFILPEWFKREYSSGLKNMLLNERRLSTPFDLHETLKEFLNLEGISNARIKEREKELKRAKNKELPRGISLFLPVPLRRDCLLAGIPGQFCVCDEMENVGVEGNALVAAVGNVMVSFINALLLKSPQCVPLALGKVLSAQVLKSGSGNGTDFSNVTQVNDTRLSERAVTFLMSLMTSPSNATFEGRVTRHQDGSWNVSQEISRTNLYGNQSFCVDDYKMKLYCYC